MVKIKKTASEEIKRLLQIEEAAFQVNEQYFLGGEFPDLPEGEEDLYSLEQLYNNHTCTVYTVLEDEVIIGGIAIKAIDSFTNEIPLFFLSPECQGHGVGQEVIRLVESTYPEIETWRLTTPTEVLRNAVFYINKCGYHIVWVDYDKKRDEGMFVFEKKTTRKEKAEIKVN